MCDQGCTPEQIAAEMGRQFSFRARQAWRHAYGWTQDEVAAGYNRHLGHDQAPMTGKRISDYEAWPHGGKKPTINALAVLARVYSTGVLNLVDLDDRHALSTQELITLDTHNTPPTALGSPDPPSKNSSQNPTATGERTAQPESNISITLHQTNHTQHQGKVSSKHRRWHLALILLLAIATAISATIITQKTMTGPHPTMPPSAAAPSDTESPHSPVPPPLLSPVPTAPIPRQPFPPLSTPVHASPPQISQFPQITLASPPAPATQQTPPPAPSDPLPPLSGPQTADTTSAVTTAVSWKNMYYNTCLDEQEPDIIHDPANLELWDCNGFPNEMWTEKTIVANPMSIAKNLVSAKTGRCVTYQPGDYSDHSKVWLTPCGKDGQGWIRIPNGAGYMFEAAEVRGMCMAATTGTVTDAAGTYIGILLRRCDSSSPLKDWRFY
jgi:hypothetical protein